jgi:hypothetical protein
MMKTMVKLKSFTFKSQICALHSLVIASLLTFCALIILRWFCVCPTFPLQFKMVFFFFFFGEKKLVYSLISNLQSCIEKIMDIIWRNLIIIVFFFFMNKISFIEINPMKNSHSKERERIQIIYNKASNPIKRAAKMTYIMA